MFVFCSVVIVLAQPKWNLLQFHILNVLKPLWLESSMRYYRVFHSYLYSMFLYPFLLLYKKYSPSVFTTSKFVQVKGQGIYAFVTLVEGVPYSDDLRKSLIMTVRSQVSSKSPCSRVFFWLARLARLFLLVVELVVSRSLMEILGNISY